MLGEISMAQEICMMHYHLCICPKWTASSIRGLLPVMKNGIKSSKLQIGIPLDIVRGLGYVRLMF